MLKAQGRSGGTKILLEAMSKDQVHLARFVLDALDGDIVDSSTDGAQTPLISSVLLPDGHMRCRFVELLLQRGAAVDRQDGTGRTALSHACERGHLDAVQTLIRSGADPEVADVWGNTALMYAAAAGRSQVVEFLVRAFKRLGLQVDRRNKAGNSAREVAKFLGHTACMSALSGGSRRGRDGAGGPWGPGLGCGDKFERNTPELLQICVERESEGSSSSSRELLTPKPPPRASHQPLSSRYPRLTSDHKSAFFCRTPPQNSAPCALAILLTPILTSRRADEPGAEKTSDLGVRTFHHSYYEKRCSLPTSVLSPTPPERTLAHVRKSRPARLQDAPPCRAEALRCPASTSSFSVLSSKLLRRFTSPEFIEEDRAAAAGRLPRSETFPPGEKHSQVGSKASVDSISSVQCEFDFHTRVKHS